MADRAATATLVADRDGNSDGHWDPRADAHHNKEKRVLPLEQPEQLAVDSGCNGLHCAVQGRRLRKDQALEAEAAQAQQRDQIGRQRSLRAPATLHELQEAAAKPREATCSSAILAVSTGNVGALLARAASCHRVAKLPGTVFARAGVVTRTSGNHTHARSQPLSDADPRTAVHVVSSQDPWVCATAC